MLKRCPRNLSHWLFGLPRPQPQRVVTSGLALSAGLSVVWLPADRGQSPHSPEFQAEPPRALPWALGRSTNSPERWKDLQLSKSRQTGPDREGPQTGSLREQVAACVQGADQTPSGRREARRDRWRLCLMGQSREKKPPQSLPAARLQGEESQQAGGWSPPYLLTPQVPALLSLGPP